MFILTILTSFHRNSIWNLFTQIVNKMLDKRHHRFSLRLLFKRPNHVPLIIQNGINSHLSGTYKYAIGKFIFSYFEYFPWWMEDIFRSVKLLAWGLQRISECELNSIYLKWILRSSVSLVSQFQKIGFRESLFSRKYLPLRYLISQARNKFGK